MERRAGHRGRRLYGLGAVVLPGRVITLENSLRQNRAHLDRLFITVERAFGPACVCRAGCDDFGDRRRARLAIRIVGLVGAVHPGRHPPLAHAAARVGVAGIHDCDAQRECIVTE